MIFNEKMVIKMAMTPTVMTPAVMTPTVMTPPYIPAHITHASPVGVIARGIIAIFTTICLSKIMKNHYIDFWG